MSFVDIFILLVLAITVLGGYYQGFVNTVSGIAATVLAFVIALVFVPLCSSAVKGNQGLFNSMLYYTEGAEYVAVTDVELTRTPISGISAQQLSLVIDNADMPKPMDRAVTRNIATEAFSQEGITTLGDYFNQTIVCVFINILSILAVFLIARLVFAFLIRGVDYARGGFPILSHGDGIFGAALGLVNGVLLLFVVFLAVPIALTVLPRLYTFLEESFFGEFFYRANFLLDLIPAK